MRLTFPLISCYSQQAAGDGVRWIQETTTVAESRTAIFGVNQNSNPTIDHLMIGTSSSDTGTVITQVLVNLIIMVHCRGRLHFEGAKVRI